MAEIEDLSAPKKSAVVGRIPMVGGNTVPMKPTVAPPTIALSASLPSSSKYSQLLAVIEDMGRDIRPTYAGSKSSVERIKRHIVHARLLVRECLIECEKAARS